MAIITEHEQVDNQNTPIHETEDFEENKELLKKVNELLSRAKRYRKRYDYCWYDNYTFVFGGKQWSQDRPQWRFSECVNMTWANIMTEVGIQTDARPKFEFSIQEFNDEALVDILRDINDRNWEKYKWSMVVQDGLINCKTYHVHHSEVTWDQDLEFGAGDVAFRGLNPFYCFWDPRATDLNKGVKARYFFYTEPVPTSELKLKYPDKKNRLKPDVSSFDDKGSYGASSQTRGIIGSSNTAYDTSVVTRIPTSSAKDGLEMFGGEPHTVLIRLWLRDDALEEICEESEYEEGGEKKTKKEYLLRKKYPKGRYIEAANNCILRDGSPGVEIDGEWVEFEDDAFPIARLVNYQYPGEYAGENEVTHTKGPQKIFNYIWSYILDMFKMQGNPITIVGDAANLDEEEVINVPGSQLRVSDINQVRRETGTPITPGSFDLLSQAKSVFDQIQGLQDVSRGADTPSVGSGVLFEGYLEAAQTRPRLKNRALDAFLQDAGELMLRRILQFYTKPRVYRITNKEGFPEFIEFFIPEVKMVKGTDGIERPVKVAKLKKWKTDGTGAQTVMLDKAVELKGDLDVRVTSGSALPFAKAQKNQAAMQLYTNQAIDQQELLKSIDWPNYEEVLRRMEKAKAQEAEAQAGA